MPAVRLALAILLLAAPASAATIDGRTITSHAPVDTDRGRVILLHGFTGTHTFYDEGVALTLREGLQRKDYQVLTPDLPYSGPEQAAKLKARLTRDNDGGTSYIQGWRRTFRRIVSWADHRYGRTRNLRVIGISWGGFHAMHAVCATRAVAGWAAISPVVDPVALSEFAGLPVFGMSLDRCARERLRATSGEMSYGTADMRVGIEPQRRLAGLLSGSKVSTHAYRGLGHTTTPAAVERVLAWADTSTP